MYIVMDDVQFLRRGWHHRDKIKTPQGELWLTLPVKKKGNYDQLIKDVELDNEQGWRKKHLETMKLAYKKAPGFDRVFPAVEEIYGRGHGLMIDLNMDLLRFMAAEFGIPASPVLSSSFVVGESSTQKLIELVKAVKGTVYLTGTGAKEYLQESEFEKEGIAVVWQEYQPPVYRQQWGEFIPMLSSLDYLFNAAERPGMAPFTAQTS